MNELRERYKEEFQLPRVLIIDDEPNIVMVLKEILNEEGFEISTATDGITGLKLLETFPRPEILLLDLFMPGLGGREFVIKMRSNPNFCDIPVILITGAIPSIQDYPPEGSYQEVIGKPFDILEVISVVRRFLAEAGQ